MIRRYMICFSTINDTSSKYKKSYTSGKSCSILTTLNNRNRLYFLDKVRNVENHFSFMLYLVYAVPKRNFFRHLTYYIFLQNCEYIKMHFFLAFLMNGMNLIMTFEVVELKVYFVTLHQQSFTYLREQRF